LPYEEGKWICGPDITDWLIDVVMKDWDDLRRVTDRGPRSIFDPVGSLVDSALGTLLYGRWSPQKLGGKRDVKTLRRWLEALAEVKETLCGHNCIGYTICERCVKADVPGNLGAGAVIPLWSLKAIGSHLGLEPDETVDLIAYDVGKSWRDAAESSTGDRDKVGDELCKALLESEEDPRNREDENSPFKDHWPCYAKAKWALPE
jgi:hypothetical protein